MRELKGEGRITTVACTTTASPDAFTIEVHHDWSPNGAKRFVDLVKDDFFTDVSLFRCVKNFLVQFGVPPVPASPQKQYWRNEGPIKDDPNLGRPFKRGTLSFAGSGPDSRTTQLFITYSDLGHLGKPGSPWETPVGIVTKGMNSVVDKFYQGYGDQQPFNKDGISQVKLQQRGNEYLRESFPKISYLQECHVVEKVQGKPKVAKDDDGLWAASQEKGGGAKQGGEEWVAHAQWLHHGQKRPEEQEVAPLMSHGALSASEAVEGDRAEEVEGDRAEEMEGVPLSAFVFLMLTLGAVFVVWKRSRRANRRSS